MKNKILSIYIENNYLYFAFSRDGELFVLEVSRPVWFEYWGNYKKINKTTAQSFINDCKSCEKGVLYYPFRSLQEIERCF